MINEENAGIIGTIFVKWPWIVKNRNIAHNILLHERDRDTLIEQSH